MDWTIHCGMAFFSFWFLNNFFFLSGADSIYPKRVVVILIPVELH